MRQRSSYQKGELASLGTVLADVYEAKEWTGQWRLFHLAQHWPEIVGPEIARLTEPAFFRQDTLWMYVQNSTWMHHLQYVKPDLLARINRVLEAHPVRDIRWQLQPAGQSEAQPSRPEPLAVDPEREQMMRQLTEAIANPDSREALRKLWRALAALSA